MVTLPVDTTVLQGAAYDLEGDTLSMQFSIVSQPAGASAQLLNLETLVNVIRTSARNMTVPGNYVFQLAVSNSSGTSYRDIVIAVFPLNNAPVITSVSANPMNVVLPSNSTQLSAITSDPNGDTITNWWMVQSAPVGANPIFSAQGERITQVSNLTIPGVYVFSLRVIDRTLFTQKNDTVVVKPDTTSNTICPGSNATFTTPISGTGITYQWQQNIGTGFTNLTNSSLYSGVTSNTLILTNPPTSYYGYTYHCLVTNNGATTTTTTDTLKFVSYWIGAADSAWENPLNWGCDKIPDNYTDVIMNAGVPNYPVVNSNAACRSLLELYGIIAKVNAGYSLTVEH